MRRQSDNWWLIVATGPSLKRSDLDLLRGHCRTVAVNCGVFFAPWADVLYAADGNWWRQYGTNVRWFTGLKVARTAGREGVTAWRGKGWKRTGGNSGHMAIQYAVDHGAKDIALIGFDHQKTDGKAHCHKNHPKREDVGINLGNVDGIKSWPRAMDATAKDLEAMNVNVVNLTRVTALDCFERITVEEFVACLQ